jgi:hypothetical protein
MDGAEPVRADTMQAFADAVAPAGLAMIPCFNPTVTKRRLPSLILRKKMRFHTGQKPFKNSRRG